MLTNGSLYLTLHHSNPYYTLQQSDFIFIYLLAMGLRYIVSCPSNPTCTYSCKPLQLSVNVVNNRQWTYRGQMSINNARNWL